jgi:hypothetical protein
MQNLKLKMDANLKAINEMQQVFERWKVIDGYDNYSVSSFGRVKNTDTGRVLRGELGTHGYLIISLSKNGKGKTFRVHILVAHAFIDNPNNKKCVDHINNDRLNNNRSNLRYASHKENNQNASMSKNNTSGIKGVSWHKKLKKWRARIMIDGITVHLGYYDNIEDAKKVRIERANIEFGVYTNSCEKQ